MTDLYAKARQQRVDQRHDSIAHFADRVLLRHIVWRGGIGDELQEALRYKRQLVAEFASYTRDGDPDATQGEFVRQFRLLLGLIGSVEHAGWDLLLDHPLAANVFPAWMAEGIDANGELDLA